jgi:prepilin-type processing-associated H-X9-DG protein
MTQYPPGQGSVPPPHGYPPVGYAGGQPGGPVGSSGAAIAALILGIVGMCVPLLGVGAIICGAVGMSKTSKDPRLGGRGMAIAGLVLGIVGTLFSCGIIPSILLPSLNRARETANRVKCASNLKQIGSAILLYSNENRGAYPPDLKTALATQDITSDVFVCPSSNDTPAPGADNKLQAANLGAGGHLSYVYVGAGLTNSASPDAVVVYEPTSNHNADGMNVLYGDGHVAFLPKVQAQHVLDELKDGHNPPQ